MHGSDSLVQGIVMPPRVAPQQVIVIPIPNAKLSPDAKQVHHSLHPSCAAYAICIMTVTYQHSTKALLEYIVA